MGYDGNNPELWELLSSKFVATGLSANSDTKFSLPVNTTIRTLYPNPSNSSITLDFSSNYKNENATIVIFDLLGRPVKTVSILLNENQNYSWGWDLSLIHI